MRSNIGTQRDGKRGKATDIMHFHLLRRSKVTVREFLHLRAMASIRQEKVARLIQRELAELFQREARSLFGGLFITVTKVRMTPDFGLAKVYLSFLAVKDKDEALMLVKSRGKEVRYQLAARIKNNMRKVPELAFFIDDSLDYAEHIDELLKK